MRLVLPGWLVRQRENIDQRVTGSSEHCHTGGSAGIWDTQRRIWSMDMGCMRDTTARHTPFISDLEQRRRRL
jgi:hypothetical protein